MATFTWTGQATDTPTNDVTIGATDKFSFYATNFNDAITTTAFQDSSHVENSGNTETCTGGVHMSNTKWVSSTNVDINGAGSEVLSGTAPTNAECPLKINFAHGSAVATSSNTFWADDGATSTAVPTDVTFQAGEQADTTWTQAEGSAAGVTVADSASSTSHDFFLFMSASPDTVGVKTAFRLQMQLTYS